MMNAVPVDRIRFWGNRVGFLFSILAALLSCLLIFWSLQAGANPPGCGEGSGCASVLGSKWSHVFGIPVGAGALILYITLAFLFARPKAAPFLGSLISSAILGSILWFVFLQIAVLKAFCVYCMVDHSLGAVAAVLYLLLNPPRVGGLVAGDLAAVLLILVQVIAPEKAPFQLTGGDSARLTGSGGEQALVLVENQPALFPAQEPVFGNPGADRLVAIAVDYACPHCRTLHAIALEAVEAEPEDLGVMILPTPIHPSCNPAMQNVPDRFANSCEVAALSLMVHAENPEAWQTFDQWLFVPTAPRSIEAVREKVREVLGSIPPDALQQAEATVKRNVELFMAMPLSGNTRRVPVTWGVGRPPVIGPILDPDYFHELTLPPSSNGETSYD